MWTEPVRRKDTAWTEPDRLPLRAIKEYSHAAGPRMESKDHVL